MNYYTHSMTTGNQIPLEIIMKSRLRKFFLMPWIMTSRTHKPMGKSAEEVFEWSYAKDIGGYRDHT